MAFDLEPLATARRADGVFEQLRERILSGALEAGRQLPNERELAEAVGVNRASVREALKRLEFLELVEVRHGHGTFVRELSESSSLQLVETLLRDSRTVTPGLMRQVLDFRRDMTLRVGELAAQNRTEEQIERAEALLAREREQGSNPERALLLDVEFNRLLGEATGNLMYRLVTNLFTKLLRRLGPLYYNERRDHGRSLETHSRLLRAIAARDSRAVRGLLESMLDYSEAAILAETERLAAQGRIGPRAKEPAA